MKTVSISGSLRENVGKKDAKMNRNLGKIPCVLYGGKEQIHFATDEKSFNKVIFTPEVYIIKLNINGKEIDAILQDVQYHPVSDQILHVDFLEVLEGRPVIIKLPVILEGNAIGVLQGGRLIFKIRKIKVKALVEHLPENIIIDISKFNIGDTVRVEDIKIDKLEFLDPLNAIVVGVRVTRIVEEEVEEEEVVEGEEGEEGAAPAEGESEDKGKDKDKGKGKEEKGN
ncbi:MAG: 50S ribosomal protein L25/general stress protein Ctc [Bacteroidales bacterium]|nr:50S ribosomal protein L25/general stress protein Ctc [Bacteroidales bacterium]